MIIITTRMEISQILSDIQKRFEKTKNFDLAIKVRSMKQMINAYENDVINNSDCKIYFKQKGTDELIIDISQDLISDSVNNICIPLYGTILAMIPKDQRGKFINKAKIAINRGMLGLSMKHNLFSVISKFKRI